MFPGELFCIQVFCSCRIFNILQSRVASDLVSIDKGMKQFFSVPFYITVGRRYTIIKMLLVRSI